MTVLSFVEDFEEVAMAGHIDRLLKKCKKAYKRVDQASLKYRQALKQLKKTGGGPFAPSP